MTLLDKLRRLAERHGRDIFDEVIPGFSIGRLPGTAKPIPMIYEPMVCLVLSGAKRVYAGNEVIDYGEGQQLVCAVDMPVTVRVIPGERCGSYLAIGLKLDPLKVADLAKEVQAHSPNLHSQNFCVAQADQMTLDAWRRLCELLDRQEEIPVLAPLIKQEIVYRLLRSSHGSMISQLASANADVQKIRAVAAWIRANYTEPMTIEQLAKRAAMSVSVFHRRFKEVTTQSPLQFQKTLRLYEARSRLAASRRDTAGVSYSVGYESPSQFSREYKRKFGVSPTEDVARAGPVEISTVLAV